MEMNTRLQVEHPVTELITGQDLVEWQLRIADGSELPITQDQVKVRGHALEARIYAEDPDNDFLPATGSLKYLRTPAENAHVRVDTGVIEGDEVSVFYDPMIAKLIVWDENREAAINRMVQALEEYRIAGLKTNTRFLRNLADAGPFRDQDLDTGFIDKHRDLLFPASRLDQQFCLAIAAAYFLETAKAGNTIKGDTFSPFSSQNGWRLNSEYARPMKLMLGEDLHELSILEQQSEYEVTVDEASYRVSATLNDDALNVIINGHRLTVHCFQDGDNLTIFHEGEQFQCRQHRDTFSETEQAGDASLAAPMNGAVVAVLVEKGQEVTAGQTLVIMEAMKMEHSISAPTDGVVADIFFAEGDLVNEGSELIALDAADEEAA
jgi:3-methylcrotonyl-CoA carboxylase alpha subunit